MFGHCKKITTLKALKNWNVSNGKDFGYMFEECISLINLDGLQNWNVSNGESFRKMFDRCFSLVDIQSLENWGISKGFDEMFWICPKLSNPERLFEKWGLSKDDYQKLIANKYTLTAYNAKENCAIY